MARTPEAALLTARHHQLQHALSVMVTRDLLRVWGVVDPTNLSSTIDPFTAAGVVMVRAGFKASAAAASRYYVDFRRLEGVRGGAALMLPEVPADEEIAGGLRGAGLSGIMNARKRGQTPDQAAQNGFVKMTGTARSFVLGGGRSTLLSAIMGDPQALGWQRVTDSAPCSFCRKIAARGLISKREGALTFEAHGHCGCGAEPFFDGSKPLPVTERLRQEEGATLPDTGSQ